MTNDSECPVCDRRIPAKAERCPNCGAYLTMASFEDLEQLAHDISLGVHPAAKVNGESLPGHEAGSIEAAAAKPAQQSIEPQDLKHAPEPDAITADPEPTSDRPPIAETGPSATTEKAEEKDEGKKGIGRLFGRKKK